MSDPMLAFRRLGESGPDLVFLHGLYGAGRNWQSLARQLCDRYRVWLPDLRNHGKSFHAEQWDYGVMAADVAVWAQSQNLEGFALIGHSMGGKVAMQYALDQKEKAYPFLSHLVIVDIAPRAYASAYHQELLAALATLDLSSLSSREQAEQDLAAAIPETDVRRFLLSNLQRSGAGWEWQLNLPVLRDKIGLITQNVAGEPYSASPVLFVAGGDSDYVRQEDVPAIKALFPGAVCVWIKGAGHWVHVDKPAELLATLAPFLT